MMLHAWTNKSSWMLKGELCHANMQHGHDADSCGGRGDARIAPWHWQAAHLRLRLVLVVVVTLLVVGAGDREGACNRMRQAGQAH